VPKAWDMFRAYEGKEGRQMEINEKYENVIQIK
jgi:hypothetical protein